MIVGKGNVYVSIIAFDSDPSKIIVSQARRDASLSETDSNRIYIRTMTTGNLNACRAAIHIYNLPGEVDHLLASVRHVSENAGRYMTTAQAR